MRRRIIFDAEARLEFEDAVVWYEGKSPGLGGRFEVEVHATSMSTPRHVFQSTRAVMVSQPEFSRQAASTFLARHDCLENLDYPWGG